MGPNRLAAILLRRSARSRTSKDTRASASWEISYRRGQHCMRRTSLSGLQVNTRPGRRSQGFMRAGLRVVPLALGRGGIKANKREGDGGTPSGRFFPVRVWWRGDRIPRPLTSLPLRRIGPADAWCEDPSDRRYNQPFERSASEPGDRLWRDDGLYDLFIEIDHNIKAPYRRARQRGIHSCRAGRIRADSRLYRAPVARPTEACRPH